MIIVSKYLMPKRYLGLTIWPFIFLKYAFLKDDVVLINHERIHIRQQIELLILPFFILYLFEFLFRFIQYRSWKLAYCNISFEREAYLHENDFNYLKTRSFWSFARYLKR
ncbi:hypothetical protein ES674_13215 [Bizionia myxarmorum]|uniref:DUF4157 domain-containing protein n=2 Tax=Bizionia myxarmorum TaxID=291186 RepID=A0A5D0R2I7_9FLAO|nr:hypothetical protein ES674_13215 [Bizionia myxarmorum]